MRIWNLQQRLLLRRLDEVPDPECHAAIMREAETAVALASQTPFPLLLFPCLFEERAGAAVEHAHRQSRLYWKAFEVETAACVALA